TRGSRALLNQLGRRRAAAPPATAASPRARRLRPIMRVATDRAGPAPPASGGLLTWLRRGPPWLGQLVLGPSTRLRERLRLSLGGILIYAFWLTLMHGYALPHGLITPTAARALTACDLFGILVFYPLIRSGWSARWPDSQLALPQLLFGSLVCALGIATVPDLRYAMLQLMCFVQLFGMAVLTARQTRVTTTSAVVLLLLALGSTWNPPSDSRRFVFDALIVATSCYVIISIGVQSYRFSRHRAQVQQEQGALADAIEHLRSQLIHDPVTGVYARAHLAEWLEREVARCERTGQRFCVALMRLTPRVSADVVQRGVADDLGLLRRLATLGRTTLRATDLLGRWSPQELLALLPDTAASPLCVQGLDRLRAQVATQLGPPPLGATLSCGIAEYRAGEPLAQLLARAERGLHAAQASGGNRCVLAD
ncbi:GGDEF domain-containing protein, partial [Aquabacterium sp.]|uniref:GGDEF domain-containing protein n=1 Tax=Aquabacterium sp. TaxID=1872578 RepID=UPI0035B2E719